MDDSSLSGGDSSRKAGSSVDDSPWSGGASSREHASETNDAPWSAAAFEEKYVAQSDPFHFASSPYEREKYRATLAALPRPRFRRAFEPGCSIGELSFELAGRCDELVATDVSPTAIRRARQRCAELAHLDFRCEDLRSHRAPRGSYDLIVFSEIGYYLSAAELELQTHKLTDLLAPGGTFLAVHWLGHSADHQLHGDEVHEILAGETAFEALADDRRPGYRMGTWRRR